MKRISIINSIFAVLGSLILLFIIAPLVGMVLNTSPESLFEATVDKEVLSSVWLTLLTAFFATLVSAIAVIPLSYLLAKKNSMEKDSYLE